MKWREGNMKRVYLDNSSTTFPKPREVVSNMKFFIEEVGCNINRGSYHDAYSASGIVLETRELLCSLFGFDDPKNVIFTPSITYALNYIIKGFLKQGDHVLVSSMEHNALMRPLVQMQEFGVTFDRIACNDKGELCLNEIESLIKPNTKAIFMLHSSNVCGTIMPISEVGKICRKHSLKFIVDSAQTAGVIPVDMKSMNIDVLAFTGHKGLLGPQGIGGFILTDEMADLMYPLISGGTGSLSYSEVQPSFLPDKFESGTMNLPGIYGLNGSLKYIEKIGTDSILSRERELLEKFLTGMKTIDNIRLVGTDFISDRTPICSVDFTDYDNAEISSELDERFSIMTRCGLHCAPFAHKTLNTFPQGTVRFSVSHFNTEDEIDYAINAVKDILKNYHSR